MGKLKCIKVKELPLPVDRVLIFPETVIIIHNKVRRGLHIISCPYLQNAYGYGKNKDLAMLDFKWRVTQTYYDALLVTGSPDASEKYWPAAITAAKKFLSLSTIRHKTGEQECLTRTSLKKLTR